MNLSFIEEGKQLDRQNQFPRKEYQEQQMEKYPFLYGESEY